MNRSGNMILSGNIYKQYPNVIPNVPSKKQNYLELQIKYKTEMCKFWQISNECKFKENVKFTIILVCICSWSS
jgi:hypothetical protein